MKARCAAKGCTRMAKHKGFCSLHYQRHMAGLPMDAPVRKVVRGPLEKRLRGHLKIDAETGCHIWTGRRDANGYGHIGVQEPGQRQVHRRAHRVAWELANGPIPEGLVVMHMCDNPACCNPEHMRLGTRADNARDRAAKGRGKGARERDLERFPQWGPTGKKPPRRAAGAECAHRAPCPIEAGPPEPAEPKAGAWRRALQRLVGRWPGMRHRGGEAVRDLTDTSALPIPHPPASPGTSPL